MIISLNGFVLNDPTNANSAYLQEPISGLSLPPIRTSSGNYSGRDGGYIGSQFYGMRLITLTGQFFSTDVGTLETARRNVEAALATSSVTMNITTNAGNQYVVYCYLDSLTMDIMQSVNKAPFIITLIAADPVIYDNSASGLQSATLTPMRGGGITWPITWPITWAGGSGPITLNNPGNVTIYPVITMTDQMTNPVITNQTTGQFFSLSGLTTTAGDVVTIDMKNRTVLLNGGSILPYLTTTSSWLALIPGNNSLSMNTSNGADTVVATVKWKTGYRGI